MMRPLRRELGYGIARGSAKHFRSRAAARTAAENARVLASASRAPRSACISERSGCRGQGVDASAPMRPYMPPARGSARRRRRTVEQPWRRASKSPLKPETRLVTAGRDTKGQHGFVNPRGLSRLDRALSDRRGSGRPPRALSIWPARHPDLGGAGRGARRDSRARPAPASRCCRPGWRRFRPRCCRSPAPAITSWSPTASIGRPAISATACSSAWASTRPITTR